MRIFLIRLTRKADKKAADVVLMSDSREAAVRVVRKSYQLGEDYEVTEMMSWGPNIPVRITGQY